MNWKNLKAPLKALVIVAVCVFSIWSVVPLQKTIHLGLDLQGGARLLLQLYPDRRSADDHRAGPSADARGHRSSASTASASPSRSISNVGVDRILVELPAVKDPDQAEQVLKQVAVLEYKIVPFDVMQKADAAERHPHQHAERDAQAEGRRGAVRFEDGLRPQRPGRLLRQRSQRCAGELRSGRPPEHHLPDEGPGEVRQADDGESAEAARHLPRSSLPLGADHPGPDLRQRTDHRHVHRRADDHARQRAQRRRAAGQREDHRERDDRPDARQDRLDAVDARVDARALGLVLIFMIVVYRLPGLLADVGAGGLRARS